MITLRNKIGQMLIMGFNGCRIHDQSPAAQWLSRDGLGGVLLFDKDLAATTGAKNIQDRLQIKQLIHELTHFASLSKGGTKKLPLFTAIDYEGGAIDRLANISGCMPTMDAKTMAQLPVSALEHEFNQMADTLKNLGFNLNFAPVVDLHLHNEQGIIGALQRSFSDDPDVVARLARKFVEIFQLQGIATCYKHFPGHGSALGDTHQGFVDVTDTYNDAELAPYYHLGKDVASPTMIMTAHVINRHLDNSGLPATLSYEILTRLLRETIGFEGVIISDDLQMQAIADHYSLDDSLQLTINAGADMIIFANQLDAISATEVIDRIENLVLHNKINEQRIEAAFKRIVALKEKLGATELA